MTTSPATYTTLGAETRYEPDKIKGSRFIACASPATTEDEAAAFIESVRRGDPGARHVCYAWRLGAAGDRTRSSDDGEPSGSAGRPILAQIEGHGLTDAVVAVIRYFGGVKLGVGGLVRAYGGAAGQALDRAELRHVLVRAPLRCSHAYEDSGAVQGVLAAWSLEPVDEAYGESVSFTVRVGIERLDEFERAMRDATAARAAVERIVDGEHAP
ncbi:MAG: YigZ family protein [Planctomycetota bacterium]